MTTSTTSPSPKTPSDKARPSRLGVILTGIGAFLTVISVLALIVLPGQVKQTPLDIDERTVYAGTAQILDTSIGELVDTPVKVFQRDRVVEGVSKDGVVVFDSALCLTRDFDNISGCVSEDDPAGRLVNVAESRFATDRKTAVSVPADEAPQFIGDATPSVGLVNKWPFSPEKKNYEVWDRTAKQPMTAEYVGEETIQGLKTYHYRTNIDVDAIEILRGIQGSYTDQSEWYIDTVTGAIVHRATHQERAVDGVTPALIMDIEFTDDTQTKKVDSAKSNGRMLKLATLWGPIAGLVIGVPMLAYGLLSLRRKS